MNIYVVIVDNGHYDEAGTVTTAVETDYQTALAKARDVYMNPPSHFGDITNVSVEHWFGGMKCCVDDIHQDGGVDSYLIK